MVFEERCAFDIGIKCIRLTSNICIKANTVLSFALRSIRMISNGNINTISYSTIDNNKVYSFLVGLIRSLWDLNAYVYRYTCERQTATTMNEERKIDREQKREKNVQI